MQVFTKVLFEVLRDKIFNFIDCEVKKELILYFNREYIESKNNNWNYTEYVTIPKEVFSFVKRLVVKRLYKMVNLLILYF